MDDSEHFTYQLVGDGVWAAIARPGRGAASNAGIVDTGECTLVFDTTMTPVAAGELRAAARILSGKEPLEVVNSHWHLEHTLGNRVFGGCTIRSTVATQELIQRHGASVPQMVNDPEWSRAAKEAEKARDLESRPLYREELSEEAATRRDLEETRDAVGLRLPDQAFRGRYTYPGGRNVTIVEGAGHSVSDSAVFVPPAEVMLAGDLVVANVHPNLESSDIDRWLTTLDRIRAARPRLIVPGHGPVTNERSLDELGDYLRTIRELAAQDGTPAIPDRFAQWGRPSRFAANLAVLRTPRAPPAPPPPP